MSWALEFHDSRLAGLHQLGRNITIQFEPAYLHRSDGEPGISPGSGWHQNAELVFRSASIDGPPDSEGSVSEGTLNFQGVKTESCAGTLQQGVWWRGCQLHA
ncbi:MAG: hypothetical protein ABF290_15095 [Thiogranum sp.]